MSLKDKKKTLNDAWSVVINHRQKIGKEIADLEEKVYTITTYIYKSAESVEKFEQQRVKLLGLLK